MAGKKTALFSRKVPNGVYAFEDQSLTTGDRYYAHSGTGTDAAGYGYSPDKPCASIAYILSQDRPTANQNDIIYAMPGHAETVAAAAGMVFDIEGVTLKGLGNGDNRPKLTLSATGSDIDIDAANITIENIIFVAEAAVTASIDVNKAFFKMKDCLFMGGAAAETHKIPIITDANADDMTLENVRIQLLAADDGTTVITTTSSEAVRLVGADRAVIKDCYFSGDFTTSGINGITTASLDIQILDTYVHNIATENIAGGIDLVAGCTGEIDNVNVFVDYDTANTGLVDAASCNVGRIWVSNEVGEVPVLHGTLEAGDVEAQIIVIDGIVDNIKSDLIVSQSDVKTIGSDLIVTNAIVDTIASDLVVSQSDIKTIGSDLIVTNAIIDTITSDLVVSQSDIKSVGSDLVVTNAIVDTIASDLIVADALIDTIKSDLIIVQSDVKTIHSDLIVFYAKYASDVP